MNKYSHLLICVFLFVFNGFDEPAVAQLMHLGNPIGLNSNIGNQRISGRRYAVPFVPQSTGAVQSVFWWARHHATNKGYSSGTGGVIQIGIHENRQSPYRGEVDSPGQLIGKFKNEPFDLKENPPSSMTTTSFLGKGVVVRKGEKYWVVFKNVDKNPTKNYLSLNGPHLRSDSAIVETPFRLRRYLPRSVPEDIRAFQVARPFDELYLHYSPGNHSRAWTPYKEDNKPATVSFPFCVVNAGDGEGVTGSGFVFPYGPAHCTLNRRNRVDDMPMANGNNRIMQIAKFTSSFVKIENAKLKIFGRSLGQPSKLSLAVNGIFKGDVQIGGLDWYSFDLDFAIQPNFEYKFEFSADDSAKVVVMCAPMFGDVQTRLGYAGGARRSADAGLNWKGYPFGHRPEYDNVQLCFYVVGESKEY